MQPQPATLSMAAEDVIFRGMFAARKQVFVDLLKWELPVLADAYEIDHFDTVDAEYVILTNDDLSHRASARLLRTEGSHLLGDIYPVLCDGPVPSGPTIREITRFCLDRNQSTSERRSARNQLVTALADHALQNGITDYTGVAEQSWAAQIFQFGWQCLSLGPVWPLGHQKLVAIQIHIDDQTIAALQATGVYEPSSLQRYGAPGGRA